MSYYMHDLPLLKLPEPVKQVAITEKLGKSKAEALGELHGKARTNDDKRRAVTRLLEDAKRGTWSNYEVAWHCGVSDEFVRKLRKAIYQPLVVRETSAATDKGR